MVLPSLERRHAFARPQSLLRNRHCRAVVPIRWQDLEVQQFNGLLCSVVSRVAHVARFEKAITRSVHRNLLRLNVGQLTGRYAPDARSNVVMRSDVARWIVSDFSHSKLVFSVELDEVARNYLLQFHDAMLALSSYGARRVGNGSRPEHHNDDCADCQMLHETPRIECGKRS